MGGVGEQAEHYGDGMSVIVPVIAPDGDKSTVVFADPPVVSDQSVTFQVGPTAVLEGTDSGNGNLLIAQSVDVPRAGAIQSLSFNTRNATGQAYLAVYDTSGPNGNPGKKLGATAVFTPVAGWNTKPLTGPGQVTVLPGKIWIAYEASSSNLEIPANWGTSRMYVTQRLSAFGVPPATFAPTPSDSGLTEWSLYATLLSVGPPPPPDIMPPSSPTNLVGVPAATSVVL